MNERNDVQSPAGAPIVGIPTGTPSGSNVGTTTGNAGVAGAPPASSFEGGPIVETITPKDGESVPNKGDSTGHIESGSGYARIPGT
jgi:hypothetical protein